VSLGSLLRRWFGGKPAPSPAPVPPAPTAFDVSHDARLRHWEKVGAVESDVITHLISPGLMGGPNWPTTRQAYRMIRRANGSTILATDGLSDPFDGVEGMDVNGFEMELFIECADLPRELAGGPGDVTPLQKSWMFALLSHVAGIVANNGGIVPLLDRYGGVLSMELPGVSEAENIHSQLPEHYVTTDDVLGVLIGGPGPDFAATIPGMPLSPVRIVPIVLLTAAELAEIRAGDETTREAVAAALAKLPYTHVARDSLV
jgi:hypothetical protein